MSATVPDLPSRADAIAAALRVLEALVAAPRDRLALAQHFGVRWILSDQSFVVVDKYGPCAILKRDPATCTGAEADLVALVAAYLLAIDLGDVVLPTRSFCGVDSLSLAERIATTWRLCVDLGRTGPREAARRAKLLKTSVRGWVPGRFHPTPALAAILDAERQNAARARGPAESAA